MITTLLLILLVVLVFTAILDLIPAGRYQSILAVVLIVILVLWLLGGVGNGRAI